MNCKSVQTRLSSYVDGEARGDESLAVREHLSSCPECQAEYEGVRQLKVLMRSLSAPEPPTDLGERIIANCRAAESRKKAIMVRIPAWGYVGVAAASIVATFFVLQVVGSKSGPTPTSFSKRDLSFELQRDRLNFGSDPMNGAPLISTSYAGR